MGRDDASVDLGKVPSSLSQFLDKKGDDQVPIVCIAFGSITLARSHPFQDRAVAAARRLGARVVVVDPEVEEEGISTEDSEVFRIASVPYALLFPRCSIVVHHGGAGTLQDCLWANTPQLVSPILRWSDQPFWAKEVEDRGLGIRLGEGGEVPEVEKWESALKAMLGRLEALKNASKAVASKAGAERGAEAACQILEDALLSQA
eukprot:TRINITY_DN23104_c0_g1_i1.p1 TRINITY_DN23104_c0_g1~~TRINITY_DN23104_c0_g1_i1.p1  ORF type:complete len:204 (-),score=39.72 TRINITY_DN23104_c0_g1_i1:64-675(-)